MLSSPQWRVEYRKRRPTLTSPLTSRDYATVIVGAMDREGAAAAFRQRFDAQCEIVSVSLESATGPA